MATFKAVNSRRQTKSAMHATLLYIADPEKARWGERWMASGHNCTIQTSLLEMTITKQQFHKTGGKQYYHFVQSFHPDEKVSAEQVHQIGLEFTAERFPDFEAVVATHTNTAHLHNHFLVNSVSFKTGKKLHQSHEDLQQHRQVNDQICIAHGLSVLEPYVPQPGKNLEGIGQVAPLAPPYIHTDSRQRRREALKKLAQGHKLESEMEQEQSYEQRY